MKEKIDNKENVLKFEELELSEKIKKALKDIGYIDATEIQQKSIPCILEGRDLIGQSQTGTGKTASFGLPMIQKIDEKSKKTQAIVLCPTRELAVQVTQELRKYLKYYENIKCMAVYGGESIERQIKGLKKGVQIIVGTPGRVMDHMRRKTIKLDNVNMVVLDEADEMLNMGFEEDIETIIKDIPEQRQTILFSATMNKRILGIAKKYLSNPKNIKIKAQELTVERIKQEAIEVKVKMKDEAVVRILNVVEPKKAIIFCNTKKKVDLLIDELKKKGFKAESLHGDIKQSQRDRIMKKLKSGEIKILVATDVAARGIDVKELELVINYDIPQELEYYVHRIGRTGRNGKEGIAYTFYTGKEKMKIREIEKYANTKIPNGKIPTLKEVDDVKNSKIVDKIENIINSNVFNNLDVLDMLVEKKYSYENIAKALLTLMNNEEENDSVGNLEYTADENGEVRLFLNVGRKDKIMVKDIVGCFKSHTALTAEDIGRINILDNFSFVNIPEKFVSEVMENIIGKSIKNKKVNIEIANN
ncbi:MAG: DEAD/DEAH box helicase [Clostridiales bacterium]|nr:DEAD/DEAH box helicase [Clostridiales bacterium]